MTFVHCGQTVGRIKTKLAMQGGHGPGHIMLDGVPVPLPTVRVEVTISKLDRMCGALPILANFVALEQQIILVKTESESV